MDNFETLSEICSFLTEFSWIFNFQNVKIYETNQIERWPSEWTEFLKGLTSVDDLKKILLNETENCPNFVRKFVKRRSRLIHDISVRSIGDEDFMSENLPPLIPEDLKRGMTPKKAHEVLQFSNHVQKQMDKSNCHIVDIGSGLGYVDQILSRECGHSVYGIESCSGHSDKARQRADNIHSKNRQITYALTGNDSNQDHLEKLLPDDKPLFLIGLHACGDLTPIMLNWFKRSQRVSGISVVSCCYHKMKDSHSFPMSEAGRKVFENQDPIGTIFARRLASQDAFEYWVDSTNQDHLEHAKSFGRRSLLELFGSMHGYKVEKIRRKCGKFNSSPDFVSETLNSFKFLCKETSLVSDDEIISKLKPLYEEYKDSFLMLELITGLQSYLQSLLELVIISDRMLFLRESGFQSSVKRLFDVNISPRCFVITCNKAVI